ncbi:MAG TPA: hypothetical protein VNC22_03530, partial [Sporichthya sp.]|nr:hypothetical protein [Sporichthya sp.]
MNPLHVDGRGADAPARDLAAVRDGFAVADYTTDGVSDVLGSVAELALARHETVPARRVAWADGTPLAAL